MKKYTKKQLKKLIYFRNMGNIPEFQDLRVEVLRHEIDNYSIFIGVKSLQECDTCDTDTNNNIYMLDVEKIGDSFFQFYHIVKEENPKLSDKKIKEEALKQLFNTTLDIIRPVFIKQCLRLVNCDAHKDKEALIEDIETLFENKVKLKIRCYYQLKNIKFQLRGEHPSQKKYGL